MGELSDGEERKLRESACAPILELVLLAMIKRQGFMGWVTRQGYVGWVTRQGDVGWVTRQGYVGWVTRQGYVHAAGSAVHPSACA